MNWNDYEAVWKHQELPVGASADVPTLLAKFETKHRKLATTLLVRDWSELGACGFLVSFYLWFWRQVGRTGWPMALAIVLILFVGVAFLRERRRARRSRLGAAAPLLAKIEADLAELHHQRRLLGSVAIWYLGPCAAAMLVHGYVIVHQTEPGNPLRQWPMLAGFGAFFALVFWFAWAINRRAVRRQIEPRIEELEKLRRVLPIPN